VNSLYKENYKTLMKENEEDTDTHTHTYKRKTAHVYRSEKLILLNAHTFQCSIYLNTKDILHRNRESNPIMCREPQKATNSHRNSEQKNKAGGT
jgi:hypothetical protein